MSTNITADAARVAHHFDDAEQQYNAAELGMWLFLATEVLFFGGLFCLYAVYRYWYPIAFAEGSHHLDVPLGTINTAVLLTSSLTMVLAVHAAQTSQRRATVFCLGMTMVLGAAFLGVKGYEYYHKFEERLVLGPAFGVQGSGFKVQERMPPTTEPRTLNPEPFGGEVELFFSLYFAMTGLHALHMVIGIAILGVLLVAAGRGAFSAGYFTPIEMIGLYWHFVDIVWVFLFPLLYLIR